MTQRRDGICRRCRRGSTNSGGGQGRGVRTGAVKVDRSAGPIHADEVGRCEFAYVPVYRSGLRTDQLRGCKNAVRLPERFCHQHGGNPAHSFAGKTVAKATAEAQRGELYPVADEHWESAQARHEVLEGRIAEMLRTDPSRLAELHAATRRGGIERFSNRNQFSVLLAHYGDGLESGLDDDDALARAIRLALEPHFTRKDWAAKGRNPNGSGVPVVYYRPGQIRADDDDAEDANRPSDLAKPRRRSAHPAWGVHLEYPLSATQGAPYEQAPDPHDVVLPKGQGDASVAYDKLKAYASQRGYRVREVADRPSNGAYAYWNARTSEIVVWNGIADGDRRAMCHGLAHELGHAEAGHGTTSSLGSVRPDREATAETVAYLTMSAFGFDTSELSSHYVHSYADRPDRWRTAASAGVFREAATIADRIATNLAE